MKITSDSTTVQKRTKSDIVIKPPKDGDVISIIKNPSKTTFGNCDILSMNHENNTVKAICGEFSSKYYIDKRKNVGITD